MPNEYEEEDDDIEKPIGEEIQEDTEEKVVDDTE